MPASELAFGGRAFAAAAAISTLFQTGVRTSRSDGGHTSDALQDSTNDVVFVFHRALSRLRFEVVSIQLSGCWDDLLQVD